MAVFGPKLRHGTLIFSLLTNSRAPSLFPGWHFQDGRAALDFAQTDTCRDAIAAAIHEVSGAVAAVAAGAAAGTQRHALANTPCNTRDPHAGTCTRTTPTGQQTPLAEAPKFQLKPLEQQIICNGPPGATIFFNVSAMNASSALSLLSSQSEPPSIEASRYARYNPAMPPVAPALGLLRIAGYTEQPDHRRSNVAVEMVHNGGERARIGWSWIAAQRLVAEWRARRDD